MAAEGKYHNKCRTAFNYRTQKNKQESEHTDVAMIFLCTELTYAAEQNQVLLLSDVWTRYKVLAEDTGSQIPQSFISRRSSFKEKLIARVGELFEFVQPLERDKHEREPILVPYKYCHQVLAGKFYDSSVEDKDEMLTMPTFKPEEDDFLSMIHIALKLRREIVDTPGHKGFEVSEESAIAVVPNSLFMFLNVLLGGQQLLDSNEDDDVPRNKQT